MNRLVITADDFGLNDAVNAAVEAAHAEGILSAASLMVAGPAAADAIARARRLPNLRVGLHLVLVAGAPLSDRPQIPNLIDSTGRLRTDLAGLGTEIMLRRSLRSQVAKEIGAQFEAFRASGLPLDHVNSHRHFHLHPAVAAAILAIGPAYGMRALRVPAEPWHILAQIDPRTPRGRGWMTSPWASLLRRRARHAGLTIADAVFGLAWSGGMTAQRFAALAKRLPAGMVEIYFHPATTNTFPGAAPGYRYVEEFAALCDAECIAAVRASRYALGGYG